MLALALRTCRAAAPVFQPRAGPGWQGGPGLAGGPPRGACAADLGLLLGLSSEAWVSESAWLTVNFR